MLLNCDLVSLRHEVENRVSLHKCNIIPQVIHFTLRKHLHSFLTFNRLDTHRVPKSYLMKLSQNLNSSVFSLPVFY